MPTEKGHSDFLKPIALEKNKGASRTSETATKRAYSSKSLAEMGETSHHVENIPSRVSPRSTVAMLESQLNIVESQQTRTSEEKNAPKKVSAYDMPDLEILSVSCENSRKTTMATPVLKPLKSTNNDSMRSNSQMPLESKPKKYLSAEKPQFDLLKSFQSSVIYEPSEKEPSFQDEKSEDFDFLKSYQTSDHLLSEIRSNSQKLKNKLSPNDLSPSNSMLEIKKLIDLAIKSSMEDIYVKKFSPLFNEMNERCNKLENLVKTYTKLEHTDQKSDENNNENNPNRINICSNPSQNVVPKPKSITKIYDAINPDVKSSMEYVYAQNLPSPSKINDCRGKLDSLMGNNKPLQKVQKNGDNKGRRQFKDISNKNVVNRGERDSITNSGSIFSRTSSISSGKNHYLRIEAKKRHKRHILKLRNKFQRELKEIETKININKDQNLRNQELLSKLKDEMALKMDVGVLEEFARYVATPHDVKKLCKSIEKSMKVKLAARFDELVISLRSKSADQTVDEQLSKSLNSLTTLIDERIKKQAAFNSQNLIARVRVLEEYHLKNPIISENVSPKSHEEDDSLKEYIKDYINSVLEKQNTTDTYNALADKYEEIKQSNPLIIRQKDLLNLNISKLERDFDEKLFLISNELSACKAMFSRQALQPFYRCAQWIWNCGYLKLGSAVPWNLGNYFYLF